MWEEKKWEGGLLDIWGNFSGYLLPPFICVSIGGHWMTGGKREKENKNEETTQRPEEGR